MNWVINSWKFVPNDVVRRSITSAGFSIDYRDWHIALNDALRGFLFSVGADGNSSDDLNIADIANEFDDLVVASVHYDLCSKCLIKVSLFEYLLACFTSSPLSIFIVRDKK